MTVEGVPLVALTYHTIANTIAYAEGDTYNWPEGNVVRNLVVCGFADFDPDGGTSTERRAEIMEGIPG